MTNETLYQKAKKGIRLALASGLVGLSLGGCSGDKKIETNEPEYQASSIYLTGIVSEIYVEKKSYQTNSCGPVSELTIGIDLTKNMSLENRILNINNSDTLRIKLVKTSCDFSSSFPLEKGDKVDFVLTKGFEFSPRTKAFTLYPYGHEGEIKSYTKK